MKLEVENKAHDFELISQGYFLRYKTGMFNRITGAEHVKEIDLRSLDKEIAPVFKIGYVMTHKSKKFVIIHKK